MKALGVVSVTLLSLAGIIWAAGLGYKQQLELYKLLIKLIGHLAWPVLISVIIYLLRKPLVNLLETIAASRLEAIEVGGVKLKMKVEEKFIKDYAGIDFRTLDLDHLPVPEEAAVMFEDVNTQVIAAEAMGVQFDPIIYEGLGNYYRKQEQWAKAMVRLRKAEELSKGKGIHFCNFLISMCLAYLSRAEENETERKKKLEESLIYVSKANLSVENDPEYYFSRGLTGDEIKKVESAYQFFRGWILDEMEKFDEAIKAYQQTFELNPDYYWALYNQACSFAKWGKYEDALQKLSQAIEIGGNSCKALARTDEDFSDMRQLEEYKYKLDALIN